MTPTYLQPPRLSSKIILTLFAFLTPTYLQPPRLSSKIILTLFAFLELYTLSQDTNFSQGLAIDWSRNDAGYHGAVGQGEFPNYFSQINTFATDGSAYTLGPDFGPNEMIEGYGYPLVQPNDLAIVPIPEPGALLLLAVGVVFCGRCR